MAGIEKRPLAPGGRQSYHGWNRKKLSFPWGQATLPWLESQEAFLAPEARIHAAFKSKNSLASILGCLCVRCLHGDSACMATLLACRLCWYGDSAGMATLL